MGMAMEFCPWQWMIFPINTSIDTWLNTVLNSWKTIATFDSRRASIFSPHQKASPTSQRRPIRRPIRWSQMDPDGPSLLIPPGLTVGGLDVQGLIWTLVFLGHHASHPFLPADAAMRMRFWLITCVTGFSRTQIPKPSKLKSSTFPQFQRSSFGSTDPRPYGWLLTHINSCDHNCRTNKTKWLLNTAGFNF